MRALPAALLALGSDGIAKGWEHTGLKGAVVNGCAPLRPAPVSLLGSGTKLTARGCFGVIVGEECGSGRSHLDGGRSRFKPQLH
jgi:hypothetical protein